MKKNYTHIIMLIDRSGSMSSIQTDMEGGIKTFIEEQKSQPGLATLTAAEFDTTYDKLHSLKNLQLINEIKINPRGGTALIDSMCKLIDEAGKELAELPLEERPEKVLFITITDGEENSSREFTNKQLAEKIKHQEDVYKWEFVYIGANQDAFGVASAMGIKDFGNKSMTYNATTAGVNMMFASLNSATTRFRNAITSSFSYTAEEQDLTKNTN